MLDLSEWLLIFAIILISLTLLMIGLSVIPWCRCLYKDKEKADNIAAWRRMAIPHHDAIIVSVPPLPPFLLPSTDGYDKFSTFV